MAEGDQHPGLGPGREFDIVRHLIGVWGRRAEGIGDDAAIIAVPPGEVVVVSTDSSVESVHFRRDWLSPREIGYRSATASLSDLAAMGARPLGLLVALVVPEGWLQSLSEIAEGIGEAADAAGTRIVGGDTSSGKHLTLCCTVLGAVSRPVTRGGARPGDTVYVTGTLGGPALAIDALRRGTPATEWSRMRFARPMARIEAGRWLAARGAGAMIDVSDGLSSDLAHLAAASGVRMRVALDRIPAGGGITAAAATVSGEEYELVATSSQRIDCTAFETEVGVSLTEIGRVESGHAGIIFEDEGRRVDLPAGYDHFSR
ncbi:MAG: thiamine-phosphate kinase [Gemmatimonadota bacterium]